MGRACLATNAHTTFWYIVYGIVYCGTKTIFMTTFHINYSEFGLLYLGIVMAILMVMAMTCAKPNNTLANIRPTSRIFSWRGMFTMFVPIAVHFLGLLACTLILMNQANVVEEKFTRNFRSSIFQNFLPKTSKWVQKTVLKLQNRKFLFKNRKNLRKIGRPEGNRLWVGRESWMDQAFW